MNSEEQNLIDGLFSKLKDAESTSTPRDAAAEARIKEHLTRQPAAPYYMAQAILVQEAAVNQLNRQVQERDAQIQTLQAELQQARGSSGQAGGGFLSGIFGGGASKPGQPASGGWRDGPAQQPGYAAQQAPRGSGFLGGALQTAAGVAGGVMLAEGISSLFSHHDQPQEIVEVIHDQPMDQGEGSQYVGDDGFDDSGSDLFSDDDSFV
ncbi:DUF2076 domain-containing protein [Pseudomonas sp. v388]|uniref:DUF2076 domain-containing protein n=1 Tax=Pseudomonas sp. v388 TaxID=2479849 RepID=UPI000F79A725|nr:DUF2076 domain-containing protein [Pseudomonas sp. v388]RRV06376.1 DUF2076 domain-containing protein [Pseudomonas sp. v388]